jgi:prepilin-type N-terminal cleavage/methylation domain-containing protein
MRTRLLTKRPAGAATRTRGFTLAEVAVTLVIVALALTLCIQSISQAKFQAAYTRNFKLARDLGQLVLGQVHAGLYAEEIENGLDGTFAEEGYPEFAYEVVVGDETFDDDDYNERFDSWAPTDSELEDEEDEDEEEIEEPYEKVKIRVIFPQIRDYPTELVLEQWMEWDLVYGPSDEEGGAAGALGDALGGGGQGGGSSLGGGR